ncbi:hypothetical protein NPIL_81851 [Nephila pilipes]|uniref:C2H2-type domain-containing protein n=1 Tax=Nephila pilipes TaxID=299642 RepID=A0A8X6NKQ8_NEPPI|nr:hypothetical protein NPIL_81851 [Nephila pilipes]
MLPQEIVLLLDCLKALHSIFPDSSWFSGNDKQNIFIQSSYIRKTQAGYSCQQCSYVTNVSFNFKRHLRTHTGERPFNLFKLFTLVFLPNDTLLSQASLSVLRPVWLYKFIDYITNYEFRSEIDFKSMKMFLSLNKVGEEELLIHTFGSKVPTRIKCPRVQVKTRDILDKNEVIIEALEIDVVTSAPLDSSIKNLWKLDTLAIRDPVEVQSRKETEIAALNHFKETVVVDNEERLKSTMKKLLQKNLFEDYEAVFNQWTEDGVIENVPFNEIERSHYLPHRSVLKNYLQQKFAQC